MTSATSSPSPGKAARRCAATCEVAHLAVAAGQGVVGDLAQHVLGELVAAPLRRQRVGGHGQHLPAHQLSQRGPDGRFVLPGHRDQGLGGEAGAQHRGVGHQPPHTRVERVEAGGQQRVQAVRDGQLPDIADQPVDALDGLDDVAVDQGPHRLHREQRDALRLAGDRRPGRRRHPGHQGIHQLVHRRRIQRVQGQRGPVPPGAEPRPGAAPARVGRTPAHTPAGPASSRSDGPGNPAAPRRRTGRPPPAAPPVPAPRAARRTAATRRTAPPGSAGPRCLPAAATPSSRPSRAPT